MDYDILGLDGVRNVNFRGGLGEGLERGAWVITWTLYVL